MELLLNEKIDLEKIVLEALQEKLQKSINWQELHRIIGVVIDKKGLLLVEMLSAAFDKVFADKEFEEAIIDEFRHKVAKNLVAKLEGAIEKDVNKFRNDPIMNAKLIVAIENIINKNVAD